MWFWLVVALLAGVGEVLTTGLFLAIVAVAAVLAAIVALVLPVILVQVALFAGASLAGVAFLRPVLIRALGTDSGAHAARLPQSQLIGRRTTVTRTVDSAGGQVRIGDGEFWSARAYDPDDLIPVGAPAEIMVIDGLTALVSPVVPLTLEDDAPATLRADSQLPTEKGA